MSNASPNKKKLNMDSRGAAIPVDDGFRKVGCDNFKIFGQGKTKWERNGMSTVAVKGANVTYNRKWQKK